MQRGWVWGLTLALVALWSLVCGDLPRALVPHKTDDTGGRAASSPVSISLVDNKPSLTGLYYSCCSILGGTCLVLRSLLCLTAAQLEPLWSTEITHTERNPTSLLLSLFLSFSSSYSPVLLVQTLRRSHGYSPSLLPRQLLYNFSGALTDVPRVPTGTIVCTDLCLLVWPSCPSKWVKPHSWKVVRPGFESCFSGPWCWEMP